MTIKRMGQFLRQSFCLCLLWLVSTASAGAHELEAAILDLETSEGAVEITLDLALEAQVAGLNLDGLADTNEADGSDVYDALRALEPDVLGPIAEAYGPRLVQALTVYAGEAEIPLTLVGLEIPDVADVELLRTSRVTLTGELPFGARELSVGWAEGGGLLIVRQQGVESPFTQTISGGEQTDAFSITGGTEVTGWQAFVSYIWVGFEHIIPLGFDHILFVLGLFFLAPRFGPLLWQVSAFTLAHTITLALAATGVVTVPAEIVEPLIALSIVYVAVENLFTDGLQKWRPALIFGFGLLHGLGFASVLGDYGLPEGQFLPALIGFNIGVEVGQLVVIAVALMVSWLALRASRAEGMETNIVYTYIGIALLFGGLMLIGRLPGALEVYLSPFLLPLLALSLLCATCVAAASVGTQAYRQFVAIPASLAIAAVGLFWVIERVFL